MRLNTQEIADYEHRLRSALEGHYEPRVVERIIRRRLRRRRAERSIEAKRRRRRLYKIRQQEAIRNAFVSPVYLDDIFSRDAGVCKLCELEVVREEASVDHIVPLSRGGIHDPSNVQLAHRRCNSRKGNLLVEEIPDGFFTKKNG